MDPRNNDVGKMNEPNIGMNMEQMGVDIFRLIDGPEETTNNETNLTQQTTISKMASFTHPSHFLQSAIDYSQLPASSSNNVSLNQNAIFGQITLGGLPWPQQITQQQYYWFNQQQLQNAAIKENSNIAVFIEQIDGIQWIKYDWNEYKLNETNCSPNLTILAKGLFVEHIGLRWELYSIRANLPIPKYYCYNNEALIAFYFEVHILQMRKWSGIDVGFCDQHFPLEGKQLGETNTNSIGIRNTEEMWINGSRNKFENAGKLFKRKHVVGLGVIHQPNSKLECFATWNGELLGKAKLPSKFAEIDLFPALCLVDAGVTILLNFEKDKWQFKEFGRVLP